MAVSASQVSKIRACERQWAFAWQDPDPYTRSEEAAFGERIHEVARAYHAEGKAPVRGTPEGDVFLVALPHVPKPKSGEAEGKFREVIDGVEYLGYVDLSWFDGGLPHVLDYKTVKDFRFAFEGLGDFLNDPQAVLYARRALIKYPSAPGVRMTWLYLKREGRPKARPVHVSLTRAEILEAFARVVIPRAERLITLKAQKPDPRTLTPNTAQCYKYGVKKACKYLRQCGVSVGDRMEAIMGADLLAELESKFAGVNPPEAPKAVASAKNTEVKAERPDQSPVQSADMDMIAVGKAVVTLLRLFKSL